MTKFKLLGVSALFSMLSLAQPPAFAEGRQVAAPPWSAACMTDHGPSDCGEPMWIYGAPDYVNGQVPSYTVPAPFHANPAPRLTEGRNAAGFGHFGPFNNAPSGRDAMVQSLGN
jgi:hypothetical protein